MNYAEGAPLATLSLAIPDVRDSASERKPARIPALDGIRGVAVALVLLYHFFIFRRIYPTHDPLWLSPIARLFDLGSSMGWVGVQLFFVLSGFLITGILDDARGRTGYFRVFYSRRALRILPLYYAVLIVYLVVFPRLALPAWANTQYVTVHQGWYWLFATNSLFASAAGWPRLTAHFWTLAIEEQFYLVWPMLVWWLSRRNTMRLCQFILCGGFALRFILLKDGVTPQTLYLLTPTELDGLVVGAFLALALRENDYTTWVLKYGRLVTGAAAVVIGAVFLMDHGLSFRDPVVSLLGFTGLAVLFGAITWAAARDLSVAHSRFGFSNPMLTFLGRYSYAIYLLHLPIILFWRPAQRAEAWLVTDGMAPFAAHLCYILGVSLTIVAAALVSWRMLERPMLRLRPRAVR